MIADGAPEATVTEETLQTLYRIDVNVMALPGNGCTGMVCMPAWAM